MVQLADDCFAFSEGLLPMDDMRRLIAARIAPVAETENVPLNEAIGRVVASDMLASDHLPPFDNSAVDGFAVRHDDLLQGKDTRLIVAERIMAGQISFAPVKRGEAVRIFTGAPMPKGADTVFMQEDCRADGHFVILPPGLHRGANRRLTGEDVKRGAVLLPAGRRLTVADLALAAAQGLTHVAARRRL